MRRMYSEKQIKEIIRQLLSSGKETIEGKWEYELDLTLKDTWLNGLTANDYYAKLMIKNGVAYMVISVILANETEASISTTNNTTITEFNLPENVSAKIFRKNGVPVSENYSESTENILTKVAYSSTVGGATMTSVNVALNSAVANNIYLFARSNFSVDANSKKAFDFRLFITL